MFYNSFHKKYWILRDRRWKTYLCFQGKPCKNVRCVAVCLAASSQPSDPPPMTSTAASRMHGPTRRHRVSLQVSPVAGREGSWNTRISGQQLVLWQVIPWNWEHVRFTLLEQCLQQLSWLWTIYVQFTGPILISGCPQILLHWRSSIPKQSM